MNHSTTIDWFRKPVDSPADGTLNACYNALDRHVIRGGADDVALTLDASTWTYAELLAEVGALAGVLRAFGTAVGDTVAVGILPVLEGLVVTLAAARVGAVVEHTDDLAAHVATARVLVAPTDPGLDTGDVPVVTVDDSTELSWSMVMRAGRTDPAGCADVTGDAVLTRWGATELRVLAALEPGEVPVPAGASLLEVGGLSLWVRDGGGER
ncbi:AMP-binding protein [Nocardioides sediminis]|uniref:AMP-binding protein n=1 Tax=Nocardioides sediminis TaxID=433648 RepID=UPI000D313B47|nr:AMP-binding protein [Nocardioides sediminis]